MTQKNNKIEFSENLPSDDDKPLLSLHCTATIVTATSELFDSVSFMYTAKAVLQREDTVFLGDLTHEFPNGSFTSAILLAESHITVHTWPERFVVQLDVFLCNYLNDNTEKCERIFESLIEHFSPSSVDRAYMNRL